MDSPGASDHCPITITISGTRNSYQQYHWSIQKATWDIYQRSESFNNLPNIDGSGNQFLIDDLYRRIEEACQRSVPRFFAQRYYPKPWWTNELPKPGRDVKNCTSDSDTVAPPEMKQPGDTAVPNTQTW